MRPRKNQYGGLRWLAESVRDRDLAFRHTPTFHRVCDDAIY